MFRRRFGAKRPTSRGLETRRHAARVFKKVTRQWELALNIKCRRVQADQGQDCPNGGVILLVANQTLEQKSHDALRIKRLEGTIYFKPDTLNNLQGDNCNDAVGFVINDSDVIFRAGLKKAEAPQSLAGVSPGWNPLNNGATPDAPSDYTDARWLKLWDHLFRARVTLGSGQQNQQFSCCSTQAGYSVPTAEFELGTGVIEGYDVPPVVCVPCGDVENPSVAFNCMATLWMPDWYAMRVRYNRPIVLKEAESLSIYLGWERIAAQANLGRAPQPPMMFVGGLRMLLES